MYSSESVNGWLQWVYNFVCILEHTWESADLQLQLSVYLLTGVIVLWLLIGVAWWMYGEAISNLFELRSMSLGLYVTLLHIKDSLLYVASYILIVL